MSSLSGLPPLPRVLSLALDSMSLQEPHVIANRGSKRQNGHSSGGLQTVVGKLQSEMVSLRHMDASLLTQLLTLHDTLQDVKHTLFHDRASSETNSTCSSRSLDLATLDNIEEQPEYENLKFPADEGRAEPPVIYENVPMYPRRLSDVAGEPEYLSPGEVTRVPYDIAVELMSLPPPPPPPPENSPPRTPPPSFKQKLRRKSTEGKARRHSVGQKESREGAIPGGRDNGRSAAPSGERKPGKFRRRSDADAEHSPHSNSYKQSDV